MKWAEFKELDVSQLIDAFQAMERGAAGEPGVMLVDKPVGEACKELVLDFIDNGLLRFPDGSILENVTDTGLALLQTQGGWEVKARDLVKGFFPWIHRKPLARLPF